MIPARIFIPIVAITLILFLFAACVAPTPIAVYVTPTPPSNVAATLVPTGQPPAATSVAVAPTETPGTVLPTVTFMGPIVGPNYTLPPSSTAHPTETPPASATVPPTSTPTVGPSDTLIPSITPGGPTPTPLPGLDWSLMGVQVHTELAQQDWNNTISRVTQLNVGWVKVQVAWELLQPNNKDEFERSDEFRRLELYLQDTDRRGLRILISVAKAPNWARSTQEADGPPDDPAALADFLTFFLTRNDLGSRIDAIEVWNEPNLAREWGGRTLSGGDYMSYFTAAYQAIRAYSPNMMIITAGLAPTGDSDGSVDDRTYLQQMYNAGLAQYSDIAIGVHPYSWGNPPDAHCCNAVNGQSWDDDPHFFFADTLDDYRQIMVANNHANLKMWATEFGWATWAGLPGDPPEAWMAYNTPENQADYTLRALQIGQGLDYVGPMIIWNLNLAQVHPELIEERDERIAYSLVLPQGNPQERLLYWMLYDAPRYNTPTPTPG